MKIKRNVLFLIASLNLIPIMISILVIENPSLPLKIHIASSSVFGLMGAIQMTFVKTRKRVILHRALGPIIFIAGLFTASSGIGMTLEHGISDRSTTLLMGIRLFFGCLMIVFLFLGISEILKNNYWNHSKWMLRSYAIGFGAVSQVFTLALGQIILGSLNYNAKALFIGLAWLINLFMAEKLIVKSVIQKGIKV